MNNKEYKIDRYKLYCSTATLAEKNTYILHSHETRATLLRSLCSHRYTTVAQLCQSHHQICVSVLTNVPRFSFHAKDVSESDLFKNVTLQLRKKTLHRSGHRATNQHIVLTIFFLAFSFAFS